ncbi:MAG TPA: hypothetical protein VKI62_08325, partial [Bacteroidota bacterium]|nr:hypothetical protein [Bacteroidota bacterium]
MTIRPALLVDDILFSDMGQGQGSVFLADFVHHEAASIISGDSVTKPITTVSDPSGIIYVFDKNTGLIKVDPLTGLQTQLAPASSFTNAPLGP